MQLLSLEIENIRSYTKEHLDFPKGLTLLSGDIGAGKSTILLAIEFALFGIQRGGISGAGLLRHGSQQGKVALTFSLQNTKITITRNLKRTRTGASQESGTLKINDETTSLTANELKQRILELLNYPQDLLQRDALFRYTVYTPQEEMKAILTQKPEERLALLRKLFSIDKYQRVRENAQELAREYKAKENQLLGKIEGLSVNLSDKELLLKQKTEHELEESNLKTKLATIQDLIEKAKQELDLLEKKRFEAEDIKRQTAILTTRIQDLANRKEDLLKDQKRLQEQIKGIEIKPEDANQEELTALKQKYREFQQKIDEKQLLILKQQAQHQSTLTNAQTLKENITRLDNCPTCQQDVTANHKDHITKEAMTKETMATTHLEKLSLLSLELKKKQESLNHKKEELLQKERQIEAIKVKLQTLKMSQDRAKILEDTITKISEEIVLKQQELQGKKEINIVFDQEQYTQRKSKETQLLQEERTLAIKQSTLKKELEQITEKIQDIEERVATKKRVEIELHSIKERINWLSKHLLSTSQLIERSIFLSIYTLFNDYFRQWLSTLLEDETLFVRLDSDFTPIVTQNDHETSIDYLSGGERTSLALAYRLALNKVINEFITTFKTRDLLILDEPTDGFSTEQLDRVREVLEQLHMEQIIIVSHEEQMEGYVDHVVRIHKDSHESKIA